MAKKRSLWGDLSVDRWNDQSKSHLHQEEVNYQSLPVVIQGFIIQKDSLGIWYISLLVRNSASFGKRKAISESVFII